MGLAGGYGDLEPFEFDCGETYRRFLEAAEATGRGDLVARIRAGYEQTTRGGGVHRLYRCADPKGSKVQADRWWESGR